MDKFGVIKEVVIFNIQYYNLLIIHLLPKTLPNQLLVFTFHYKNKVCPVNELSIHLNAGPITGTCRPGLMLGMVFKQSFSGGAAPLVLTANKKEVSQYLR